MPTISEHDVLPSGSRLGEFEIQKVLGVGGFGIVYLAFDHALERQVAIKEYMPASLAQRGDGLAVVVRSAAHAETFMLGLRSFINEARLLARFDHPALVKVYRFWEANDTAYMVMPYYQGQTLQHVRRAMSAPPDEAWLRRLIAPLLGALECLHRENVFHRDVAPDNILLLDDDSGPAMGPPVLLDLGAARRVIGDHTQTLTAIVKPSFAPIEQYAETVQLRQGPWTDLYALAAVVHYCITGRPPVPATARAVHDEMISLRQLSAGLASGFERQFSEPFVRAIDHALAVRPQDRPVSVTVWREELAGLMKGSSAHIAEEPDATGPGQTVLLRRDAGLLPPAHLTVESTAYMTTIPAAGRLQGPPTWDQKTAVPALASDGDAQADGELAHEALEVPRVHPTIPLTNNVAAPRAASTSSQTHGEGQASNQAWWKWGALGTMLLTAAALWGLGHQRQRVSPVDHEAAAATAPLPSQTPSIGVSPPAAPPAIEPKPMELKSAITQDTEASTVKAGEPQRQVIRKDEARTSEAYEPRNPRRACSGKTFIFLAICMKQRCSEPRYARHAECARMRQQEAAQRNGYP